MSVKFKVIFIILDQKFFRSLKVAGRNYIQMKVELC